MKWFRHDTSAHRNRKIRKVIRTHGAQGYAIWFLLLEKLYEAEGDFQIIADEMWLEDFSDDLRLSDYRILIRVFDTFAEIGLINKQLWEGEHILYCDAIAERGDKYIEKRLYERNKKKKQRAKTTEMSLGDIFLSPRDIEGTKGQNLEMSPSDPDPDPDPDPDLREEKERSTADADALLPPSGNEDQEKPKSKVKGPPKKLTKHMTQRLVDTYHELKPELWATVKVLNDKRVDMADRAYQASGRDIEKTLEIVQDALSYVSTQEWWIEKKFTFGTLFERGDGGQGDYRFIRWAELASTKESMRSVGSGCPDLSEDQLTQLRRLNAEDPFSLSLEEVMLIDPTFRVDNPNWKNVRFAT